MAIALNIYPDNDADIVVAGLPTGLTVEWFLAEMGVDETPPPVTATAINVAVSGTCSEVGVLPDSAVGLVTADPPYYVDVLEGAAITAHLLASYLNVQIALIVKVGQDLRVYGTTTLLVARPAE